MKNTSSAPPSTRSGAGFELRLERGGAYIRLADQPIAPGLRLDFLTLQIPEVKFPFDVGLGAGQFRHRLADLVELSISVDPSAADAALATAGLAGFGVEDVRLAAREGFLEIAGRVCGGPAFTLEAGLLTLRDQGVTVVFHSPRLLGPAPIPSAVLPHLARAVLDAIGAEALPEEPLPALLRRVLAPRGWKIPRSADARLARAVFAGGAARLLWDRDAGGPAAASADPDLLAADEGARTFWAAEAMLFRHDFVGAREAYLAAGPAAAAHPFAAERLLSLLALDERFHEEALDLAADWLGRRPGFEPALAAEAKIRTARGEAEKAARALRGLAQSAASRGRTYLALAAAQAAFETPGAPREEAVGAIEIALQLRRDHVPALRALREVARGAGDREALLRASRRLVAYDPDPASKARSHAELGALLLESDPPGARLHLDQALRLAPDDAESLDALSRACAAAGEPLRAVRALDRLKDVLLARGDRARAARAALENGALWEGPLGHPENALLRYREAADLVPSADAHACAARAAEAAGQWAEAADHHAAALAALDPSAPGAAALAANTHLALADVSERLGDLVGAAAHVDRAAALGPEPALLRRLLALQRGLGRAAEVLAALDRLAPLETDPAARAAVLAEAGEAALALGLAGDARSRFGAAIAADGTCRPALLGAARLARERGDAVAERDALERLLPLAAPGAEAADVLDRLAAARDRAGDLAAAVEAAAAARAAAPTPARLEASLALARRAGDPAAVAALLAERARAATASGDAAGATAAWLERARLLATNPPQALAALAEARAVSPGDPAVLRAQAALSERTGDPRLALGCLRALLAGFPDDAAELELRAARAALQAGEIQAAKDHAERALGRGVPGAGEVLDEILARSGDDAARADVLGRLGRHLEAARLLERHGDPGAAAAALERAAAEPGTASQALPRLAELRLDAGDRSGAAAALVALARLASGREAARIALQAYATGRDAAALDLAVAKDPRFAPALARRAALRAGDDPRAALADAEAALLGEGLGDDERPGLLALAARAAAAGGNGLAARRHLAAYCEANPGDDGALARLAALQRAAGARDDLARVLSLRLPHTAGAEGAAIRLELSDLLAAASPDRAAALALEALTFDPASEGALRALTTSPRAAHVPLADRAALLARLADAASASPAEAAAAHAARAQLLAETGDPEGALEAAREAAKLGEEPDDLLDLRARLAHGRGDLAEAAQASLARARRAEARGEPQAAERLADAGLRTIDAGLGGGEEALRAALALGPERETARAVLEALAAGARARGEAAAEREALAPLVPLLPTGMRPATLLRLSGLALEAKDLEAARAAADEARTLAPRDLAAIEAARAAALTAGDLGAVADLLADAAALDPASAGPRLLDRARLLAALARAEEADDAFVAALAALPPDRALADEHATHRQRSLRGRPPAAPLETYAVRCEERREAAHALRAAAALSLAAGDHPTALRCARRAWARSAEEPGFVGPLLARVLYLFGGAAEALVLHRTLLESSLDAVAPEDAIPLCRQGADLAEGDGDTGLALRALDELLRLRPQDVDAALERFRLDPDRRRAAERLGGSAAACRSDRRRALALALAARGALEAGDAGLAADLGARARRAAGSSPGLALALARDRAVAIRAAEGASSPAYLAALQEAVAIAQDSGDRAAARDLLDEAIRCKRERGLFAEAARDLLQLDALAAVEGDFAESAGRLRAAGALLHAAGDLAGAAEVLARAVAASPDSAESALRLEEVLRELGPAGAGALVRLLSERVTREDVPEARAGAWLRLAEAQASLEDHAGEEISLRGALADAPGFALAEDRLLALLSKDPRRSGERARLLLERSARTGDADAQGELRREAARLLAASTAPEDRDLAAETWRAVAERRPDDLEAAREAAGLLVGLGRREDAIPHLRTLLLADPDDDAAAGELEAALAEQPHERAELLLARADRAEGPTRGTRLSAASSALFAAGEDDRAQAALRDAFAAWPADGAGFAQALRDAAGDVDRIDEVLRIRAAAAPDEAGACHRARGDALHAAGRTEDAIVAFEASLAAEPGEVEVIASLAAALAECRGDAAAAALDRELVSRAAAAPRTVSISAEAQARYRLGIALCFAGKPAEGVPLLERALALSPFDGHAGLAWAAMAQGHEELGEAAAALAAARARVERALALGLDEERRAATEAEAELASRLGVPSALGPRSLEVGGRVTESEAPPAAARAESEPFVQPEERFTFEPVAPPTESPAATTPPADEEEPVSFEPPAGQPEEVVAFGGQTGDLDRADDDAPTATEPQDAHARAAAWIASADALAASGASPENVRAALDMACEADPDEAFAWRERARIETAIGDTLAAARAHLAASIRSDPSLAAEEALEAARLFEEQDVHAGAARAYRAAENARPDAVPPALATAADALAAGDAAGAARILSDLDAAALPPVLRALHPRKLAGALAGAGRLEEARAVLVAALASDPSSGAVSDALEALDARAEAWASAAAARGTEAAQAIDAAEGAAHYLRAARLLHERVGDTAGAIAAARAAFARSRSSDDAAARATADEASALLRDLGAPVPAPAGVPFAGEQEAEEPSERIAFASSESAEPPSERIAFDGNAAELAEGVARAAESMSEPEPADAQALAREGREKMGRGDHAGAYQALSLALSGEPADLTITRDLSRVAEKLGLHDEYVELGEVCADAISAYDPLAAAARYRHFAEVLRDKAYAPERAAVMLEKALAIAPGDAEVRRELVRLWSALPETTARALEAWTELARKDPTDAEALAGIASLSARVAPDAPNAAQLRDRGQRAASLAAFLAPGSVGPAAAAVARTVPEELRTRVAAPGATGPLARLLALLAPWLETLFPADLRRRGATGEDELDPARAPALAEALVAAAHALRSRAVRSFLVARPGVEIAFENTQPPALVLGGGVAALDAPALAFLAARTLDLVDHGWALVGKFAPKDVGILLELACRFSGGAPPSMGLPAERAGAFLAVLESQVSVGARSAARELGVAAAQELGDTDPRALAAALRRTANRVGLLYAGDPGAALRALALLDRRLGAGPVDPREALALPDLRDLALFALSDPFHELRAAVLG